MLNLASLGLRVELDRAGLDWQASAVGGGAEVHDLVDHPGVTRVDLEMGRGPVCRHGGGRSHAHQESQTRRLLHFVLRASVGV